MGFTEFNGIAGQLCACLQGSEPPQASGGIDPGLVEECMDELVTEPQVSVPSSESRPRITEPRRAPRRGRG